MDYLVTVTTLLTANQGGLLLALVCIWYLVRKLHTTEDAKSRLWVRYRMLQLRYVALKAAVTASPCIESASDFIKLAETVGEDNS